MFWGCAHVQMSLKRSEVLLVWSNSGFVNAGFCSKFFLFGSRFKLWCLRRSSTGGRPANILSHRLFCPTFSFPSQSVKCWRSSVNVSSITPSRVRGRNCTFPPSEVNEASLHDRTTGLSFICKIYLTSFVQLELEASSS